MDDLRPLCYAIITILFIIASITIVIRVYVRRWTIRAFGCDDWAMALTFFINCAQQALLYFFLAYGGGLHITAVMEEHPEWITILTKGLLVEEFWYVLMQLVVKMCFLLFYIRLADTSPFRIVLYSVMAFHVLTIIGIWLLYALQCMPLAAFYDAASYPGTACVSSNITYFVPYSLNLATDILILLLPLPIIYTLQMPLKRRLSILAVVTTGGSAVLVSGLRALVLIEFATSPDFTWSLGKMVIISSVEMQVGILAANMPALKAFWTCWRRGRLAPGRGVDLAYKERKTMKSEDEGGIEMEGSVTSKRVENEAGNGRMSATASEERLWSERPGGEAKDVVRVTVDYDVSVSQGKKLSVTEKLGLGRVLRS